MKQVNVDGEVYDDDIEDDLGNKKDIDGTGIDDGNESTPLRSTKVVKGLERVYNIGNYESVRIIESFEETITWKDLKERKKKLESINKHLISDFNNTKRELEEGLGFAEKKAFGKSKSDNSLKTVKAVKKDTPKDEDIFDSI